MKKIYSTFNTDCRFNSGDLEFRLQGFMSPASSAVDQMCCILAGLKPELVLESDFNSELKRKVDSVDRSLNVCRQDQRRF